MENRRPPRSSSSGRKPFSDRGRGAPSFRNDRSKPSPSGRGPRRHDGTGESRYQDFSRGGPPRSDGRGQRNRFGNTRFDRKPHDPRARGKFGKPAVSEVEIKITSDDQITDGKFRGKLLQNSNSPHNVRTARKLREVVFKVISRRVKAGRFLDLGAGSGTIGIEAISRGAMLATFVDRSARMCTLIRKNLAELGVKDGHGEVVEVEILPFLMKAAKRKRSWDVVYFDLPDGNEHAEILNYLSRGTAIREHGLLIVEHPSEISHPDNISKLKRWRTIDQGKTILSIYERM